jgi:hypothetical protein
MSAKYAPPHLRGTATGNRFAKMNRPPEGTSWCWLTADMLTSPAWRNLTGNAMKVVMRIALEHLRHGSLENGKLPVTYQDFVRWGVRKNSIREALLVAIHLGWIDRTSVGDVPWDGSDLRRPSTYGLTWLPQHTGASASNRWTRIKTDLDAKTAISRAKTQLAQLRRLPLSFNRQKKPSSTPKDVTGTGNDFDPCSGSESAPGDDKSVQSSSSDSGTPFYISGYPATDASTATRETAGMKGNTAASPSTGPKGGASRQADRTDLDIVNSPDDRDADK